MNTQPLLSICIPTWNRAKYLDISLNAITQQIRQTLSTKIDLLVSDNCSTDETQKVVEKYTNKGYRINYVKNEKNIGADRNFIQCMQLAKGKYILLLGDDDILQKGALDSILTILEKKGWGCVHIRSIKSNNISILQYEEYENKELFIKKVSLHYTFISGIIFRKDAVPLILEPEKYCSTNLLQLPYFIKSTMLSDFNVIIFNDFLKCGLDAQHNGGYNFYKVFVQNYLKIWQEFLVKKDISEQTYSYLKKHIYTHFIRPYTQTLLFNRQNIKKDIMSNNRDGYYIDNAWAILFKYYGKETYFYLSFPSFVICTIRHQLGKLLQKWL